MRRDVGGHTNGNAGRTVAEQIGHRTGHNNRLGLFAIIGVAKIDSIVVEPFHQSHGKFGQSRFGITHGSGIISVDVAEIALSVHQRITDGKILCQTAHGAVYRSIAVGVILTDDVADNAGAFFEPRFGIQMQLAHCKQQTAVNRFQAVSNIRQRTVDNG